ncbi:MAG TPA: hypothetical protein VFQ92_03070 [Blastocatellia bacterium]|nr:hypothetical protein [Blastocatellia bacterium]
MAIILVILAIVFLAGLALHAYKRLGQMREQRIRENEYNTAVILWDFARIIKSHLDDTVRAGTGVLDFSKILVPHSQGYRVTLELAGYNFKIYGVPSMYNKSGRLSFFIDKSMTLRASDRNGEEATGEDAEYTGDSVP